MLCLQRYLWWWRHFKINMGITMSHCQWLQCITHSSKRSSENHVRSIFSRGIPSYAYENKQLWRAGWKLQFKVWISLSNLASMIFEIGSLLNKYVKNVMNRAAVKLVSYLLWNWLRCKFKKICNGEKIAGIVTLWAEESLGSRYSD